MKTGIIISVAILIVLGAILFFVARTPDPDSPTKLTSPKNLEKVTLPDGLPAMFESESPAATANAAYQALFAYYLANRSDLVDSRGKVRDTSPAKADELVGLMIETIKGGTITQPFLDDQVPVAPGAEPAFKDALEAIPDVVIERVKKTYSAGGQDRAIRAAQAVWAMGQRAFERSVRLTNRRVGLLIMTDYAGPQLFEWSEKISPDLAGKLNAWGAALLKVRNAWGPKVELVRNLRPHQGDLINLARHEQDPTFRIEAILMAGVVRYNANHAGNAAAFEDIMASAQQESDPLIQKAGKAAKDFTRDDLHRMR